MKPKRTIFWRKFGKIVGYTVLFCLFSSVVYGCIIWMFTIKTIVVIGDTIRVQVDETKVPKTLLLFPSARLRTEFLRQNPILADIQFQKKYPHTLVIVPTLRTPVVRLSLTVRDVLLDESGVVLTDADSRSPPLPRLLIPVPAVRIGETIRDRRVLAALAFITGIQHMVTVQTVSVEDERSLRAKSDMLDILFPQDGDIGSILATLQTLLTGFRIKGTLPAVIDLRFNKPIIKF